jgi:hypothetical protein
MTTSVALLNHCCVRNTWLELENSNLCIMTGDLFKLTGLSLLKVLAFRLRAVATGWRGLQSSNLSLRKELWLDRCLGIKPRIVGITLAEDLCDWGGGITLAEGLRGWRKRAVSHLYFSLLFALQLRKSTEILRVAEYC